MNKIIDLPDLETLRDTDLYSLSMFLLYNLKRVPRYSIIGELPYLMDRDSLMNLCKYFGGKTITIPTLKDLRLTMRVLLLYQVHIIEGQPWKDALKEVGYQLSEYDTAKRTFNALLKTLEEYNIELSKFYE